MKGTVAFDHLADDPNESANSSYLSKYLSPQSKVRHVLESVLSIPLGIPDGVSYGHFGLMAGIALAGYLGLSGTVGEDIFKYLIGIGAAVGVAFFAINNISREFRLISSPLLNRKITNYYSVRGAKRALVFLLAVTSIIPFTGMAMTAGKDFSLLFYYTLVIANSVARFCMNDYALNNLLNKIFDQFMFVRGDTKKKLLKKISHFQSQINTLPDEDISFLITQICHESYNDKTILKNIFEFESPKAKISSVEKVFSFILQTSLFLCGAYTATYIFGFAESAVRAIGITGTFLPKFLSVLGVLPTAALWGDDTRIAVNAIYQKIRAAITKQPMPHLPTNFPKMRIAIQAFGLIFLAAAGAFSETRMAYMFAGKQNGIYATLLKIVSPVSFAAIYGVSVLELCEKGVSVVDQAKKTPASEKLRFFQALERSKAVVKKLDECFLQEKLAIKTETKKLLN